MSAVQLVTVSGPRGAGKELIVTTLRDELKLRRIVPHTTRAPRAGECNGREYHFVSLSQFSEMMAYDKLVWHTRIGETQYSGTSRGEFDLGGVSVIDVTPGGAHALREKVTEMAGRVLMIAIFAELEERRARIRKRQPLLTDTDIEQMLRDDPASSDPRSYLGFDVFIDNAGDPLIAQRAAINAAKNFLGC